MIVKNEEAVLERCLSALSGTWDQLVILDTGSTDNTIPIARKFTDEVYEEPWEDNFGKARNSAFLRGTCDYLMYVDADDLLPPEEREKLIKLKSDLAAMPEDTRPKSIEMPFDVPEAGGVSYRTRMIARHDGKYWEGEIHECLFCDGPTLKTDIMFLHRKVVEPTNDRNCKIIRKIPREKLKTNFWLSAQCYLDMVLAGHIEESEEYFDMCEGAYHESEGTCLQISSTLNHYKQWELSLKWVELAEQKGIKEKELIPILYHQAVKALVGLNRVEEAVEYNEKALAVDPKNRAARINRIFLEKKLKGEEP